MLQAAPLRLLREGPFRRVWLVGGLAGTIRWLEILSISVYVFDRTGSPLWVAALMVVRMLPMVVFGSIVGACAERFNRRSLLLVGLGAMSALSGSLALLAFTGHLALWHIALGAFVAGIYFSSEFSVRRTLLSELAGEGRVGAGLALDSATNNATRMLGPVIGGAVYQWVGLAGAYGAGTLAFLVGTGLVLGLGYRRPPLGAVTTGLWRQVREGVAYVGGHERISGTLLVTALVNLFGFPFATLVPVIGREELALTPFRVGLLAAAEGTGAFLGALVLAVSVRPRDYGRVYVAGAFVFLLGVLAFSLSGTLALAWPLLLAGGLGVAGFASMQSTLLLTSAAPEYRARVMGILAVCIGAGPIGVLHAGALAEWLGAPIAVRILAAEGLLILGATHRWWRPLWRESALTPSGTI